jgi:uncharacterized protein with PIN domain
MTLFHSRTREKVKEKERERERDVHICHKCQFYWYEKERENLRDQ